MTKFTKGPVYTRQPYDDRIIVTTALSNAVGDDFTIPDLAESLDF